MEAAQSIRTRDNVHTHGSTINNCRNILTLTGKELELVEEAKWYYLDIIGVSSTKRRWIWMADGNSSILVLS